MSWGGFIYLVLGKVGVLIIVGCLIFFASYKNSVSLFEWIEKQTFGVRDSMLKLVELLYLEITAKHLFWMLWGSIIFFGLGSGLTVLWLTSSLWPSIALLILGSWVGLRVPLISLQQLYQLRIKKFQLQMVDALNLLSGGLRAGLSLPQSCALVVSEMPSPISQDFNFILQQNRLGIPIDECFQNFYQRVPTQDNQMFVTCITILRETGGNLAETFQTITDVIRERVRLQQKVDTFTVMGRFQGGIIFSIPFVMFFINAANNPASAKKMLTDPMGIIALIVCFGLTLIGGYVILKIVSIKI